MCFIHGSNGNNDKEIEIRKKWTTERDRNIMIYDLKTGFYQNWK